MRSVAEARHTIRAVSHGVAVVALTACAPFPSYAPRVARGVVVSPSIAARSERDVPTGHPHVAVDPALSVAAGFHAAAARGPGLRVGAGLGVASGATGDLFVQIIDRQSLAAGGGLLVQPLEDRTEAYATVGWNLDDDRLLYLSNAWIWSPDRADSTHRVLGGAAVVAYRWRVHRAMRNDAVLERRIYLALFRGSLGKESRIGDAVTTDQPVASRIAIGAALDLTIPWRTRR